MLCSRKLVKVSFY